MITVWNIPVVATVDAVIRDLKFHPQCIGLFKDINNTGSDLMCTCPFHGGGREHNPSLGVLLRDKQINGKHYEAGTAHCFTCGYTADLPQLIADVLGLQDALAGYKWLIARYNYTAEEREPLDLNLYRGQEKKESYMDEELVKQYHRNLLESKEAVEYLHRRKLEDWVLEAFGVGFDPNDKTVLFPVRNGRGEVLFYKGRSITGKHFYNAKEIDKSSVVFGLHELINGNYLNGRESTEIDKIWLVESEIDALSLISYGEFAVAIMGSHISDEQCKELERSQYRRFVLATDNDEAGRKGASQIKRMLIPKGFRFTNIRWNTDLKDVNDLIKTYGDSWKDYLTGY